MNSHNTVHSAADREAWVGIQRKTFSRWANQYLPADSKINELVADVADGIVLSKLLARISEKSVGKINNNPRMDIQKLENLNTCIAFIRAHDIPLVNIGSSDILKGNEKLILGLFWSIILRFEVQGADGKAGLLLWLQRSTKGYRGVDVKDFTHSWQDGLAFNALIHRYRPDLINYDGLNGSDALGNCENAFAVAESQLGVSRLLDAEDVVNSPDEKSQIAYLNAFFKLFAGQAKLEAKLRAIKNAVEVTRRHDEWISHYNAGSQDVLSFVQGSRAKLEQSEELTATAQVAQALDTFDSYMRDTKPAMTSKKAEMEGIYTTLVSSKRNNKRPDFAPQVQPAEFTAAWDAMESVEKAYERRTLDKYLSFQAADHAVTKFDAKSTTVKAWLAEKRAVFEAGDLGTSVPEIEAHLEMHATYEARLALYSKVVQDMRGEAEGASPAAAQGHAGAVRIMADLSGTEQEWALVQELGTKHRAALEQALESEKKLVAMEKDYLRKIDNLDFLVDQLEQSVKESESLATVAEMQAAKLGAGKFAADVAQAKEQVAKLSQLATMIASKQPDSASHCALQGQRVESTDAAMQERLSKVSALLAAEEKKDALSQQFAAKASDFNAYLDSQQQALGALSGTLETQLEKLGAIRSGLAGEGSEGSRRLAELDAASNACDAAGVVANRYTPHTIYSLRSEFDQLVKASKLAGDALQQQLMAQKALEIPAERLREIQEIFSVFDTDKDGKLRFGDLREACLGAGIDLDDAELERRMKARSSSMTFTMDDFIAFFIEEVKTGDSEQDVSEAFKSVGNLSTDNIQATFSPISKDLADYLSANIHGGDYQSFTRQLFSR